MKRSFLALIAFLACALATAPVRAEVALKIVQPYENENLPAIKRSFVFGSIFPASSTLMINGVAVKPFWNGGFLAMIPLQPGRFKLDALASDGVSLATVTRTVNVEAPAPGAPADYGKIDPIAPKTKWIVRPDDAVDVAFQAAPGGTASFKFSGKNRKEFFPMEEEKNGLAGIYRGSYRVQPTDDINDEDIVFAFKRADGKKLTAKAGAKISIQPRRSPRVVELREDAVLLTGPDADLGYSLFLLQGTRLEVTGEKGEFLRVGLGGGESGWIKTPAAVALPAGTPPPRSVSRNIRVRLLNQSTVIEIPLQFRHAYRVEQTVDPHELHLTLYGVTADTDRIRYKSQESEIKEISWRQVRPDVMVVDVLTKQRQAWGYDVRYDGTTLNLEVRHHPSLAARGGSLKGLRVAVDAGHSPGSFGTIGPLGNTEASVNLKAAKALKQELEKRGAQVVMTQDGTKEISLQDRVALAWRDQAQVFISLHCDACEAGQDPREIEGYSVHYYHPQSHEFADLLHALYGKRTGLRDQGLWRSNLAVCRATQMPSVLLEQAFLIVPEYEQILISPKHYKDVAESVTAAIAKLAGEER